MKKKSKNAFIERCRELLEAEWKLVSAAENINEQHISDDLRNDINASINATTQTYRYVLPTQVVSKLANGDLDCRCIQVKRGGAGAFDARTVARFVIAPFDQSNHRVLGGSENPYVSNPLRVTEITPVKGANKKVQIEWDRLCGVLQAIEDEGSEEFTRLIFRHVLYSILERLQHVHIVYPIPNRPSLDKTLGVVREFLGHKTGGLRLEALIAALFEVIGERFGLFASIRRSRVNAADIQVGAVADLECLDEAGEIVLVVEVKDCQVMIRHIEDKLPLIREKGVKEALFLSTRGRIPHDHEALSSLIQNEFAAGQNIYILVFDTFLDSILVLLGETGRRVFLQHVGTQLDEFGHLEDRQVWANLLRSP